MKHHQSSKLQICSAAICLRDSGLQLSTMAVVHCNHVGSDNRFYLVHDTVERKLAILTLLILVLPKNGINGLYCSDTRERICRLKRARIR
jgi:hypothetical protein